MSAQSALLIVLSTSLLTLCRDDVGKRKVV